MIAFASRHRLILGVAAALAVALGIFVIIWFQPQKLVIEERVNEAAPAAAPATAAPAATAVPKPLQGSFQSFEHPTRGRAVVIDTGGKKVLRFENFETSNGPDVVIWLSTAYPRNLHDTVVARDFVDLGRMKGNIGNQNYDIPAGTDLRKYSSVIVWCRRFNVAFGATRLA